MTNSTQASFASNAITPAIHNGELRILDTDLGARLGFAKPVKIRDLIKRHGANLQQIGTLPTVGRVINGGNATEYYLNEEQALFITAKSETAMATKITIEIVTQFAAFKRGEIAAPKPTVPTSFREALLLAASQQEEIERQKALIDETAPKAAALDTLAGMDGFFGLREAAKECDWPEQKFNQRLHQMRWIFKQEPNRPWQAHADKLRQGLLAHKTYEQTKPNGEVSLRYQVVVTAKGLTRLAVVLGPVPEGKSAVPFAKRPEPAS